MPAGAGVSKHGLLPYKAYAISTDMLKLRDFQFQFGW